jgi:hypothetical protein
VVVAVSGFGHEGPDIVNTLNDMQSMIKVGGEDEASSSSSSGSSSSSSSRSNSRKNNSSTSKETSAEAITNYSDELDWSQGIEIRLSGHDDYFTHVIAGSNKRTLRVLFAIARGMWVLNQDWIFQSLSLENWAKPLSAYRHPHFSKHKTEGVPLPIFTKKYFFVCTCSNPDINVMKSLIETAGGGMAFTMYNADYIVFGNAQDGAQWIAQNKLEASAADSSSSQKNKTSRSSADLLRVSDCMHAYLIP